MSELPLLNDAKEFDTIVKASYSPQELAELEASAVEATPDDLQEPVAESSAHTYAPFGLEQMVELTGEHQNRAGANQLRDEVTITTGGGVVDKDR